MPSDEAAGSMVSVQVSDVFGLGKLADSSAANRLIDAIISGTGRMAGPWLLRREVRTQLELQRLAEQELSPGFSGELSLADRSKLTLRFRELCSQQNREEVSRIAIEKMKAEMPPEDASGELSDDWLSYYWRLAETVSDTKLQELWGHVLAKEASKPNSVSLRTLDLLRSLSLEEALEVQRLAAFVVRFFDRGVLRASNVGFVTSVPNPDDSDLHPSLDDYGELQVRVASLARSPMYESLGDAGFWTVGAWGSDYSIAPGQATCDVEIGNQTFLLSGLDRIKERHGVVYLGGGRGVSVVGNEIFKLANMPPDPELVSALGETYAKFGLKLSART